MSVLPRSFYTRETPRVAQDLLGKILVFKNKKGRIVETEAYRGLDDPASHAARGLTLRNRPMFGKAGFSYVYLIYGMYFCFNVVTEEEGMPGAVLIRGIELIEEPFTYLNGPGKLCHALQITKLQNEHDLTTRSLLYIVNADEKISFQATQRVGITKGKEKAWRYIIS